MKIECQSRTRREVINEVFNQMLLVTEMGGEELARIVQGLPSGWRSQKAFLKRLQRFHDR